MASFPPNVVYAYPEERREQRAHLNEVSPCSPTHSPGVRWQPQHSTAQHSQHPHTCFQDPSLRGLAHAFIESSLPSEFLAAHLPTPKPQHTIIPGSLLRVTGCSCCGGCVRLQSPGAHSLVARCLACSDPVSSTMADAVWYVGGLELGLAVWALRLVPLRLEWGVVVPVLCPPCEVCVPCAVVCGGRVCGCCGACDRIADAICVTDALPMRASPLFCAGNHFPATMPPWRSNPPSRGASQTPTR